MIIFVAKETKELEKAEINSTLIRKWVSNEEGRRKDVFINFVSDNFSMIFQIK